jgi:glycosyltransferase involved in cell wall biosynthesis
MTQDAPELSIVIPVYNEHTVLQALFAELDKVLAQVGRTYEIVFVDDGSTDSSLEILTALKRSHPEVVVVELARNYGQTAALAAGIDQAHGAIIITMDGDLQHDPAEIPLFLVKMAEGYDLVNGSRMVRRDNIVTRRLPSRIANALARRISGVPTQDFGSTYKAYRGDVVKRLDLFGELHRFIPILANKFGARFVEIPITVRPRGEGKSHYGIGRTFGVFGDLVFLLFYTSYLTRPIRAFTLLFLAFFLSGFAISAGLMAAWFVGAIATVRDHNGLLLLSVFLMIVGVQFLITGILSELLSRIYLHTSGNKIYFVRHVWR